MRYTTPMMKDIEADVRVRANADQKGSCAGGQCVRTMYAQDH